VPATPLVFAVNRRDWKTVSGGGLQAQWRRERGDTVLGVDHRCQVVRQMLMAAGLYNAPDPVEDTFAGLLDDTVVGPAPAQFTGRRKRRGRHRPSKSIKAIHEGSTIELQDFMRRQLRAAKLHRYACGTWVPAAAAAGAAPPSSTTTILTQYRSQLCRVGVTLAERLELATDPVARDARTCAGRRRHRALHSISQELLAFASLSAPSAQSQRVLCMGADFGWNGGARACFPFREIYSILAQHCLVVMCDEFRSSSFCPACNRRLAHPTEAGARDIKGTLYCANAACVMNHLYVNRDSFAAVTIGTKMVCERVLGAYAGVFSRWSAPGVQQTGAAAAAAAMAGHQAPASDLPAVSLLNLFGPATPPGGVRWDQWWWGLHILLFFFFWCLY
jgi:hypothetical protein